MELHDILLAVLGCIGTIDLGRFIFFRSSRKQAEGEADSAAVAPLKDANEILRMQLADSDTHNADLEQHIEELRKEKEELFTQLIAAREENATIKQLLCVHGACYLRKPIRGRGGKWYDDYKDDPSLGIDMLPLNQLMKAYGKTKEAAAKAVAEEETTE